MAKSYVGVAPLTMIRCENPASYTSVYAGQPVPENIAQDDLKRLVDEGFLAEVKAAKDDPGTGDGAGKPTSVKDILKDVGDDKAKAQEYLNDEQAKGDDARGSLVEGLQKVLAAEA
jgi:hypothetical protein